VLRRKRELGILSVLGFRPAQRRAVIATQAPSIAIAALVVGIPLGLVVGRVVWSSISGSIGVATDANLPQLQIVAGAVLLVIGFNVMAAAPAWAAGRLRVVDTLRAE
jgi:ABC-type antimicrobial peptide transport system permease subunit